MNNPQQNAQQKEKTIIETQISEQAQVICSQYEKSPHLAEYQKYLKNVMFHEHLQSLLAKLKLNKICYCPEDSSSTSELQFLDVKFSLHYEVMDCYIKLGPFSLTIQILNVQKQSPIHLIENSIMGSSAKIYFTNIQNAESAIKCFTFSKIKMSKMGKLLISTIKEYIIGLIASALQIGPYMNRLFGFDLIIYKNCVEFAMEKGSTIINFSKKVMSELKQNVKTLHHFKIIHMDLKEINTCYSQHFNKNVFIDFGYSKVVSENIGELTDTIFSGTVGYCCPDMLNILNNHKPNKIDLYYNDIHCLKVMEELNLQSAVAQISQELQVFFLPRFQKVKMEKIIGQIFLFNAKWQIYNQNFEMLELSSQKDLIKHYQRDILQFLWETPITQKTKNFYNSFQGIQKDSIQFIYLKRAFESYYSKHSLSNYPNLPKYEEFCNRMVEYQFLNAIQITFTDQIRQNKRQQSVRKIIMNCQTHHFYNIQEFFDLYISFVSFISEYYKATIQQKLLASNALKQYIKNYFNILIEKYEMTEIKKDSLQYCLQFLLIYCIKKYPFGNWKKKHLVQLFENYCLYCNNFEKKRSLLDKVFELKMDQCEQKYLLFSVMMIIFHRSSIIEDFEQHGQFFNQKYELIEKMKNTCNLQQHLQQIIDEQQNIGRFLDRKFHYFNCEQDINDISSQQIENYMNNSKLMQNFKKIMCQNKALLNRYVIQILQGRIFIKQAIKDWNSLLYDLQLIYSIQPKDQNRFEFYQECIFLQVKYLGSKNAQFLREYNRYNRIRNGSTIIPLTKLENSSEKLKQYKKNEQLINFDEHDEISNNALLYCRNFIQQLQQQYQKKIAQNKKVNSEQKLIENICIFDDNYQKISLKTQKTCKFYKLYRGRYIKDFLILQNHIQKGQHYCFSKSKHIVFSNVFKHWAFKYNKAAIFQDYFFRLLEFNKQADCKFCKKQSDHVIEIGYSQLYEVKEQYQKCVYQLNDIFERQFKGDNFLWNGYYMRDFKRLMLCSFALAYGNCMETVTQNLEQKRNDIINLKTEIREINKKYIYRFYQSVDKKGIYYSYFSFKQLQFSMIIGQSLIVFLSHGELRKGCLLIKNVFKALFFSFSLSNFSNIMQQMDIFRRFLDSQEPQIVNKVAEIYENQIIQEKISEKQMKTQIIGQISIIYMYLIEILYLKQQIQPHFFIKRISQLLDYVHSEIKAKYLTRFYSFLELKCNSIRQKKYFSRKNIKNEILNNERKMKYYKVKLMRSLTKQ